MTEPILETDYWKERLEGCGSQIHQSIFRCSLSQWERIEEHHQTLLAETVHRHDSVLDAGCGYGRLLSLMPDGWDGDYLGIDISPDFIARARRTYPTHYFIVANLVEPLPASIPMFDWAVLISMRPMITRNLGETIWDKTEASLHNVAKQLLLLEYDEKERGTIL